MDEITDSERGHGGNIALFFAICLALAFGLGMCIGTLTVLKIDISRALVTQREEFDHKVKIAVTSAERKKEAETRELFRVKN